MTGKSRDPGLHNYIQDMQCIKMHWPRQVVVSVFMYCVMNRVNNQKRVNYITENRHG